MEDIINILTTVKKDQGLAVSIAGNSYRIVISGKETGGAYAIIDMLIPPGGGPGPHAHANFQESFYVLEGSVEVRTENGSYTAEQGDFVNIPLGGMIHCFKNKTEKVAHLWCLVVPAGLEEFFLAIGEPSTFGKFMPPPEMTPETMKKLKAIAEKYGQQLYPPNYLDK